MKRFFCIVLVGISLVGCGQWRTPLSHDQRAQLDEVLRNLGNLHQTVQAISETIDPAITHPIDSKRAVQKVPLQLRKKIKQGLCVLTQLKRADLKLSGDKCPVVIMVEKNEFKAGNASSKLVLDTVSSSAKDLGELELWKNDINKANIVVNGKLVSEAKLDLSYQGQIQSKTQGKIDLKYSLNSIGVSQTSPDLKGNIRIEFPKFLAEIELKCHKERQKESVLCNFTLNNQKLSSIDGFEMIRQMNGFLVDIERISYLSY